MSALIPALQSYVSPVIQVPCNRLYDVERATWMAAAVTLLLLLIVASHRPCAHARCVKALNLVGTKWTYYLLDHFCTLSVFKTEKLQNPLKKSLFQGILSFLLFLDTFRIQGIFVVSPVSRHFWKMLQGSRGFVISPVSRHFHRAERRRREVRRV